MAPQIKDPPDSWKKELIGEARTEAWKYAAGTNKDFTDKSATVHKDARLRVWDLEIARFARPKPVEERTEEEKRVLFKVDHPVEYQRSRRGISCVPPIIPPPDKWNPGLIGDARTEAWKNAAGKNKNGTDKTPKAHSDARRTILREDRIRVVQDKHPSEWTDEDRDILKNEEIRLAKERAKSAAQRREIQKKKMDATLAFIKTHGLSVQDDKPMSAKEVAEFVFSVLHDKVSEMGKDLFQALGCKTLCEAFWYGDSNSALYILASRGFGDIGESKAEYIRFLVSNSNKTTVLTDVEGKEFNYTDPAFKNLELVYYPIGVFKSYANCTAVEGFIQLLFDFHEVGSKRLWLESNVGKFPRPLRTLDMEYIKKLEKAGEYEEAKNVVFFCGITILKNVSVLSRTTDPVSGKDVAGSIKAGNGTTCMVHQPKRRPKCSQAVKDELVKIRERLGPNYIDRGNQKRKADAMEGEATTTPTDNDGIVICEDDEYDSDGVDSLS
jgi:hypothetical protein